VRLFSLLWGVVFVGSGLFKVLMLPEQQQMLGSLGFPRWVLLMVGAFEVIAGTLILNPRWRPWAALAVMLEMVVAGAAHFISGVSVPMVLANAALFAGAAYLFFKERSILLPPRRPSRTNSTAHTRQLSPQEKYRLTE
jgi:uncharacterized membrane protein YphA (DoxX/SURF4 family)